MGYAHLSRLAATPASAAESFVESTPSTEYWDDVVPHDKIRHMSEYLKDVSSPHCLPFSLLSTWNGTLFSFCCHEEEKWS